MSPIYGQLARVSDIFAVYFPSFLSAALEFPPCRRIMKS
jgi:hypothetical protein